MTDTNDGRRALAEKILHKIAHDRAWRETLLSDPKAALESSGLADEINTLKGKAPTQDCVFSCIISA